VAVTVLLVDLSQLLFITVTILTKLQRRRLTGVANGITKGSVCIISAFFAEIIQEIQRVTGREASGKDAVQSFLKRQALLGRFFNSTFLVTDTPTP
jgi:hypothetical protein